MKFLFSPRQPVGAFTSQIRRTLPAKGLMMALLPKTQSELETSRQQLEPSRSWGCRFPTLVSHLGGRPWPEPRSELAFHGVVV